MDIVLDFCEDQWMDQYLYGNVTSPYLQRGHIVRESLSLWLVLMVGAYGIYFFCNTINYFTVYKWSNIGHAPFKGQTTAEISMASKAIPFMALLQVPVSLWEMHHYSKLYGPGEQYSWDDYGGWWFIPLNLVWFLIVTDFIIYWAHRWLHHPLVYSWLHKPHHLWKNPTPFASHAFHPLDGWVQGIAYHIYVAFFPMHKVVHLVALVAVNIWSTSIHDGVSAFPFRFLNGAAHHTIHHTDFYYNYGQYFVFWDWMFGSFLSPYGKGRCLDDAVQKKIRSGMTLAQARKAVATEKAE